MVSETIEAPVVETPSVDQEIPAEVAENPVPVEEPEVAAPEAEPAATSDLQVEVEAPAPQSLTREEVERLIEEKAQGIRADEREAERRRRQTEGARKASAEKREAEDKAELIDAVKTAFGAQGFYDVPDEAVLRAVDRTMKKRGEQLGAQNLDAVDQAFAFVTAPVYGTEVELDEAFEPAARRLAPRIQSLIDTIRPTIEAAARKGYIAESELPAKVEAEIARRAAKSREGQTELVRPDGQANSTIDRSLEAVTQRIISNDADDKDRDIWNTRFGRK